MKLYIYKIIIASVAIILVFKFTIGNEIAQINKKIFFLQPMEENKQLIQLKKRLKKQIREKTTWMKRKEFY